MEKAEKAKTLRQDGIICFQPFCTMNIINNYNVYNCMCSAWIKDNIGNLKTNTIAEIWNSEKARYIRRKMYDGQWRDICNPICPSIVEHIRSNRVIKYEELEGIEWLTPTAINEIRSGKDRLESPPTFINLCNSNACNLHCIMCNREGTKDDPILQEKMMADLTNYLPTAKVLILSGDGEPFVRADTLDLLINCKYPVKFDILTNGLLLPKYWEKIKHQKFRTINVSVDAATKDTYEKIRVGGKWEDLLKSLSLIRENRDKFECAGINMTVMRSNYKEIPQFIDMAQSYGFFVQFFGIRDRHGNENIFEPNDVEALNELRNILINEFPKKRDIDVRWGDLPLHLNLLEPQGNSSSAS